MNASKSLIGCLLLVGSTLFSCSDDTDPITQNDDPTEEITTPDKQEVLDEYLNIELGNLDDYTTVNYPVHYDDDVLRQDDTNAVNPITNKGATLGRVLFYDKRLSRNNTVSCASCHSQELGFTDAQVLSDGFEGGKTGAHAMRILNTGFYQGRSMFWDKRAASLEEQSTQPIQDATEMGFDADHGGFDALIAKMDELPYYPILFEEAFGSEDISEEKAQLALGQFMRSMISVNSKFDEGYAQVYAANVQNHNINQSFPNFSNQENLGKSLFLAPANAGGANCITCHVAPTFVLDANSRSNGLDQGESTVFKTPSLKHIASGGPYMHDGRFSTLEEVIEHYNSGIKLGPAIDPRLTTPGGGPQQLNLTQNEKDAIVAFLKTLDDPTVTTDEKFGDPFKG